MKKCRCGRCQAASAAYHTRRNREKAYGRWRPLVDAEPVREHLTRLQKHNKGRGTIAREAGVSPSVISRVLYGGQDGKTVKRIRAATADALLAVTEQPSHLVPAMGSRRRLQSLVAIGHPQAQLAARLNKTRASLSVIMRRTTITANTDAAVRALYDELWDQPPTPTTGAKRAAVRRARHRAQALGWRVPMEWDDTALDNPTLTVDEFKQEAARLAAEGLSLRAIGRRLGCDHGRVSRDLEPATAVPALLPRTCARTETLVASLPRQHNEGWRSVHILRTHHLAHPAEGTA